MYIKYALLILCSLLADFLNLFLAPIVALFASEEGWLPSYLSWFQTPDTSLDGDGGYQALHRPFKVETKSYHRWWNRTRWMYRNSMYGFAIDVLGIKTLPSDLYVCDGSERISNRPLQNGLVRRYLYRDGKLIAFQWYYIKAWSDTRCIRINLGWKLWDYKKDSPTNCQIVFSPTPMMGYSIV